MAYGLGSGRFPQFWFSLFGRWDGGLDFQHIKRIEKCVVTKGTSFKRWRISEQIKAWRMTQKITLWKLVISFFNVNITLLEVLWIGRSRNKHCSNNMEIYCTHYRIVQCPSDLNRNGKKFALSDKCRNKSKDRKWKEFCTSNMSDIQSKTTTCIVSRLEKVLYRLRFQSFREEWFSSWSSPAYLEV